MAQFLDHEQVREAVKTVIAGDNVRCAVAFWGQGALEALFGSKKHATKARIICDLTMGGTNPEELVALGAPKSQHLRHIQGLHAKLYLSSAGMVVTSANASNNGIGFVEPASLMECGTSHKPNTNAFAEGAKWFESLWEKADNIDSDALAVARSTWAKPPRYPPPKVAPPTDCPDTLLRNIASKPDLYRGIGVVFSTGAVDGKDVQLAAEAAIVAEGNGDKLEAVNRLPEWSEDDLFTGWSDTDANAWPGLFLNAHRGARGAVTYWCYSRFFEVKLDRNGWSIFAEPSPELRSRLGLKGGPRDCAKAEDTLLDRIFARLDAAAEADKPGCCLCESPHHLAQLLDEVDVNVR